MNGHSDLSIFLNDERIKKTQINYPLVTVIVTNYNYEQYISDCLESISRQDYPNYKCIVVDDCSTDNSIEKIEGFIALRGLEDKFTLVKREKNGGQMAAFKTGLEYAEGAFVVFVDADDILFEDFISFHVKTHMEHLPVAFTSSNQYQIDEKNQLIAGKHADLQVKNRLRFIEPQELHNPFWVWATTSSMMFRRSVLEIIIPDNYEDFRVCADNYICHFANLIGGSLLIPKVLGAYRRHGKNYFSINPVVGGRLPTGDMSNHPKHHIVRSSILAHILKNYNRFLPVLGDNNFFITLLRLTGPYEILKYKRKYPDFFKNNRFPLIQFMLISFFKKITSAIKKYFTIFRYVIHQS